MKCRNIQIAPKANSIDREETNLTANVQTGNVIDKKQKNRKGPNTEPYGTSDCFG